MFDDLKALHTLGFSLIWLLPKSKRPVEMKWTSNPLKTWDEFKNSGQAGYNVGVRLGASSEIKGGGFLAVIDCDVKSSDPIHLKEMEKALGNLPFDYLSAPTVQSGRGMGSRHIYVKTKEPTGNYTIAKSNHPVKVFMPSAKTPSQRERELLTKEELDGGTRLRSAWSIAVMGSGTQTVLPPSLHPDSGKKYAWTKSFKEYKIPLVEFGPQGAITKIKDAPEFADIEVDLIGSGLPDWCVDLIVSLRGIERYQNDRSGALFAVALRMVGEGFTDQEIMAVLSDPEYLISSVAYDHTQSRDRARAAKWIYKYTISKARYEKSAEKAFEDSVIIEERRVSPSEKIVQEKEILDKSWVEKLDRNQQGNVKNTLRNLSMILENHGERAIFGFNEFSGREFFLEDPPWVREFETQKGENIRDDHLAAAKIWCGENYGFEPSVDNIELAISRVARLNSIHPVREYLDGLEWDGAKRIDTWLKDYCLAEGPDEYLAAVGSKVLVAGVARVRKPGIKWDNVLILEGKQDLGKSTVCAILGGEWFSDTLGDIGNKDVVESMKGKWFIELGELAGLRRVEVEQLKHFISTQSDFVRRAYGRRAEDYPRQCVFIGTTNKTDYLKDETGNRRFWPVHCHKIKTADLREVRDQLFAEADVRFKEGERLFLDNAALREKAAEIQSSRMEYDEWTETVSDILAEEAFRGPKGFKMLDLWKRFTNGGDPDGTKLTRIVELRLGKIFRILGKESRYVWIDGKSAKRWVDSNPGGGLPKK